MKTRYEAWIGGVALSSIAPEIIIDDIQEQQPKKDVESHSVALWNGTRVMSTTRPSLSVSIRFMVRAYNPARRQEIIHDIVKWAKSGNQLELSTREGLFLDCVLSSPPFIKSALKWIDHISMTFTAYSVPYWQEKTPVKAESTATSDSISIRPNGTEDCFLEFVATNLSASALSSLSVTVSGKTMAFTNLNIAQNKQLAVRYVDGILKLPVSKRTPESADNLILLPNEYNTVSFTADKSVRIIFIARGMYS